MWKKAAAVLLCMMFVLSAVGCGGQEGKEKTTDGVIPAAEAGFGETGEQSEKEGTGDHTENAGAGKKQGDAVTGKLPDAAVSDEFRTGTASDETLQERESGTDTAGAGRSQEAWKTGADAAGYGSTQTAAAAVARGLVVIDPGHQQYANTGQEPIGPGAAQTKIKVSGGTSGVSSGVPEYRLTLEIGLLLRDELERRGYTVIMTRETNEVDISNSERAAIANEADADVFVRIHANGSDDGGVSGAMTICQTPGNAFNGDLYEDSRALSDCILEAYTQKTGIDYQYVWETDTMSGINWCRVPVTIVEMGYMTNAQEDLQMQDSGMQERMAEGIADGIDDFMADRMPKER